ncbi:MAG: multidrug transporter [Campylobacter sp.]|nr:multidrug transporter [Campylobacter sp.]
MIHFLALLIAGFFEVLGVFLTTLWVKQTKFARKFAIVVCMGLSFGISLSLLSFAMRVFDMSVAYAIWSGIGTIGALGVGVVLNGEKLSHKQYGFLFLIIFSVIALKLV